MKTIYRSITKELITTFILCLATLNFILMMEKLLRVSRFLSGVGISVTDMLKIILYIQPQLFLLTIPMSLLLSTLIVYGRLNHDNELMIMKNTGMDFKKITFPVALIGIFCFALNTGVSFYIGPKSTIKLREEILHIINVRAPLAIEEGRFNTSFKDILIFVRDKLSDNKVQGIFMYDSRNKDEPRVLVAKEGKIFPQNDFNINFSLRDGYINITKGYDTTELFFKKYNMVLRLEQDAPSRKNAELTPYEIIRKIKELDRERVDNLYLELYRRLSLPFLCILLIILGPPLAMMSGKSGKLGGLTLGLGVFTVYYALLIYGENLAKAGKITHYIGAWSPTVILGIIAILLFKRESSK